MDTDTGSMNPKDKEDPTAPEGTDDDDPGEDSILDQEFKRIIQIFFRIQPNKHHEVYKALQASGIVSLRLLIEDGAEVINTLQKQGKRGRAGEEHCKERGKLLFLVMLV